MTELAEITEICTGMRGIFEHVLADSIGTSETAGSCLYASILLKSSLERFAGASAMIRGGGPPLDGGVLGPDGKLHGHYWLEGRTRAGTAFVADVTADQFGFDKIIVLPLDEARTRYYPGQQARIDQHVAEETAAIQATQAL